MRIETRWNFRKGQDSQALQAKLDELLRVHGEAKNELTQIDREQPEEIEQHRKEKEREERTLK